MRWPKYWSFSFSISPSNEHPGLIFFRMDWLDLLAVQGTLKSLLQHHSSKASILWHSAFFTVLLSQPYMTTGKTIALTGQTFVSNVMSLLFNILSRLVITFLPRSKRLLISWLQSPSAVILEPKKITSYTEINSKWIEDWTLKTPRGKHRQTLFDINCSNILGEGEFVFNYSCHCHPKSLLLHCSERQIIRFTPRKMYSLFAGLAFSLPAVPPTNLNSLHPSKSTVRLTFIEVYMFYNKCVLYTF